MRMKIVNYTAFLFIILLLLSGVVFSQSANEWAIFRGDPSLSGSTRAKIKTPMELKWAFQTDDAIVAAPVVSGNTIYVSSVDGIIYAVDLEGQLKWQYETDNSIEAPALSLDGKIYVGNLSGKMHCIDARSGNLNMKRKTKLWDPLITSNTMVKHL